MVNFIFWFSTARVLIELFFFILDNAKKQANIYFTFGAGDKCQCNHEYIEHGNTYLPGKNEQVRILRTLYNDRFLFSFYIIALYFIIMHYLHTMNVFTRLLNETSVVFIQNLD